MTLDEILNDFWLTAHDGYAEEDTVKTKEAIKQWAAELVGEEERNAASEAEMIDERGRRALRSELKQKIQEAE